MSTESSTLAWAAKQAQTILAPMADPSGSGEFTISGTERKGVLNLHRIDMGLGPNGLIRVEELTIEATAAQWATAPAAAPRFAVTALSRSWWCTSVKTIGVCYVLTCVPA